MRGLVYMASGEKVDVDTFLKGIQYALEKLGKSKFGFERTAVSNFKSKRQKVWKTAFYHVHNIRKISKYLSQESLKTLVHAFVTSRLDYCNSLFYGLPKHHISKLQRVQNAAARLVTSTRKYDHITPVLYNLHWLPVFYRIYFKILILTFKAIHNMSPSYTSNLVSIKSCSAYSLRSNSSLILDRAKGRILSTLGARSFYAADPTLWNSLPANIRNITSLSRRNWRHTFLV